MKRLMCLFGVFVLIGNVGCWRPYDKPEFEEIDTSETAYLIPLEGETDRQAAFASAKLLDEKKVAAKRIQITHQWVQTGRWDREGEYMPTVRLVKVNRTPVTREWTKHAGTGTSTKDQAISLETRDSVNFSMGLAVTAFIPEGKTSNFLYRYTTKSLADMMDTEVRAKVQEICQETANEHMFSDIPKLKPVMLSKLKAGLVPFFEERGIEITAIGMVGGFTYENAEIQKTIDKTIQDQQLKISAEARRTAQEIQNKTIKLEAEAKAEAAKQKAKGEAEAIKIVSEAKAFEVEKASKGGEIYLKLKQLEIDLERLKRWDGKYPLYMMNLGNDKSGVLVQPPPIPSEKK